MSHVVFVVIGMLYYMFLPVVLVFGLLFGSCVYWYRCLGMNNTSISCLVYMVFDITYICHLHIMVAVPMYPIPSIHKRSRFYELKCLLNIVCEQLPRPTLKQFGMLSRAVLGYPIKPASVWLCEHVEVHSKWLKLGQMCWTSCH